MGKNKLYSYYFIDKMKILLYGKTKKKKGGGEGDQGKHLHCQTKGKS